MSVGNLVATAKVITRGLSPKKLRSNFKPVVKKGLAEIGGFWHERFLPLHFHPSAKFRYRGADTYLPRSAQYEKRKRRLFGHNLPLVFSGDLKKSILSEQRVSATSKKATVTLRGTRYLYPFKKNARDHDKAKELTVLRVDEGRTLSKRLKTNIEREFARIKGTQTERLN